MNKIFGAFTDSANLFWGALVTVWAHFIGANWPVFALFLVLNVIDCHYGRQKAIKTNTLSSKKGAEGVQKKVAYWVIITIAFAIGHILATSLGPELGVDLSFLHLIGWFTLAVYILNELTSIVENLLVLGVDVPAIFVRGLAVVRTIVDTAGNKIVPDPDKVEGRGQSNE